MPSQEKIVLEPSILSADYSRLGDQVREAEAAGAEAIQIDIMDGHFVPNLTFGPGIVQAIRQVTRITLDVHLMIDNPDFFVPIFAEAGANRLIVHQEVCPDLDRTLRSIRGLGVETGIALKPDTPADTVEPFLREADVIQVMTVHPGFGGQAFLSSQLEKIDRLRTMIRKTESAAVIAVDGGIDPTTAPRVVSAGATVLVAGSAIYNRRAAVKENFSALLAAARKGRPDG
jgi:ribulose-phosphate 3-epimerase